MKYLVAEMPFWLACFLLSVAALMARAESPDECRARACLALAKAKALYAHRADAFGRGRETKSRSTEAPRKAPRRTYRTSRGPAPRCTSCSSACTCGCQDGERCDCIHDGELRNGLEPPAYRPVAYTPPGYVRQAHYVPGPGGDEFRPLRYVGVQTPEFQPLPTFGGGFGGGGGRFFGGGACRGGG